MKVITSAEQLEDLTFYVMSDVKAADLKPAVKFGSEDENELVDGKAVYRLPALYVKEGDRRNDGVSLKLRAKPSEDIAEMTKVRLVGSVVVTPWLRQGRIAYSLLADGVEAVK